MPNVAKANPAKGDSASANPASANPASANPASAKPASAKPAKPTASKATGSKGTPSNETLAKVTPAAANPATANPATANLDALLVDATASLIVVLDPSGRIVRFNAACHKATGYSFEDVRGRILWEFLMDPADADEVQRAFAQLGSGGKFPTSFENHWVARDRTRRRIVWTNSPVHDEGGAVQCVIGCGIDITERRQVEVKLRESEERYALAVRGANDGIWDWDLRTDRFYVSARWKAVLGCGEETLGDQPNVWFDRVHAEDLPKLRSALDDHRSGRTPHVEVEHRARHSNGDWRWVLIRGLAIRDAHGKPYRMAGSLTDVTDRKLAEEELVRRALFDPLTGLANRALLEMRLRQVLERSRRHRELRFAVLFLDLDRFKIVNDSLGHVMGDLLLVEVARRLSSCVRPSDTVARLGGDEFIVLVEDIRGDVDASRVANRIHNVLAQPFMVNGQEVFTAASIGIAPGSPDYRSVDDLMRDADAAMYRAKATGKCRSEVFDEALHERAMEVLQLETDLRNALERGQFLLHYQPLVRLADGSVRGFEALLRWNHPDRGIISPSLFIPVLEETGLIVTLGNWVIREACRQLRAWRETFGQRVAPLHVSINVSGRQFAKPGLVEQVEAALRQNALPAQCLRLEITESVMMTNAEQASAALTRLHEGGVVIEVDDFGMGFSSLSQLHRFPISGLKIDRSFTARLGDEPPVSAANDAKAEEGEPRRRDAEIVRTIISLAHNLGLSVTAEGIESALQLERLKALRCEFGQGYLFAKPLPAEGISGILGGELPWRDAGRRAG